MNGTMSKRSRARRKVAQVHQAFIRKLFARSRLSPAGEAVHRNFRIETNIVSA
jgi:hypothetical protein